MRKEIKKTDTEWQIFMDVWNLFQDYAVTEDDDRYWEMLVKDTDKVIKKHNEHPLAAKLAFGVAKALDEIARAKK